MPKLTEKEILARLDEVDGETLAAIERLRREGNCARTIHVETRARAAPGRQCRDRAHQPPAVALKVDTMTHALDVQQAFRDLEVQAQVHTKTLETLKARVLSRFAVADHAQDAGSATEVGRLRGELATARDEARIACDACDEAGKVLARTRTELADALGALEQERECRQTYQRRLSHAMREVERLTASEAASAERERKLMDALRVGGERRAEVERSRKVLIDQVAALHTWNPSDDAVQTMQGVLIGMGEGRSAIRAGLRTAFVRDHLEACGCMREPADGENTSKETGE